MKSLVIIAFLLTHLTVFGQSDVDRFLAAAVTDDELLEVRETERFLEQHKFSSPWLRELEFRIRSDHGEPGIEDYRVRFGLLNPLEIKANRDYRNVLRNQLAFQRRSTLNDVFMRRYELLIESYYLNERVHQIADNFQALDGIKKAFLSSGASLGKFVDIEESLTKLKLEQTSLEQKLEIINLLIRRRSGGKDVGWEEFNLITRSHLGELVVEQDTLYTAINIIKAGQDLEIEESILKIDKAEAFSNLGFFQAEYDRDNGSLLDKNLGFQIGMTIPVFNTDKPDIERRKLKMIDEKVAVETVKNEEAEQFELRKIAISATLRQLEMITEKIGQLEELKTLSDRQELDLDNLRKLLSYELFLNEKQLSLTADLMMKYIRSLHQTGTLANEPFINFLSEDLHTFDLNSPE